MKSITASKILSGGWGAVMNYIETHKPVVITNRDHHDIIMVLATDYEEMKLERKCLHEALGYMVDGNSCHDLTDQIGMPAEFCQKIIDLWHKTKSNN